MWRRTGAPSDAILSVTGCHPGKRSMKILDYGKMAATFINLETGKAVRVVAKDRDRRREYSPGEGRARAPYGRPMPWVPAEELSILRRYGGFKTGGYARKAAPHRDVLLLRRTGNGHEGSAEGRSVLCRPCAEGKSILSKGRKDDGEARMSAGHTAPGTPFKEEYIMYGCGSEVTDIRTIDWNKAWKAAKAPRTSSRTGQQILGQARPILCETRDRNGLSRCIPEDLDPEPRWSVFDMACGGGTLAIPLAKKVREVTAVDFSDRMLEIVKEKCREEDIANVTTINARWEDDWSAHGIGVYDVVIASRSLVVDDLRAALLKLDAAARERVYVSTIVGDGPYDRRVFEALGRPLNMGPDYIYNYNLLYQMGIHAELAFIEEKNHKAFESREDALNSMRWMLDDLSLSEEQALKGYLDEHLVPGEAGWKMDYDRSIRWAVMWWRKEGKCAA